MAAMFQASPALQMGICKVRLMGVRAGVDDGVSPGSGSVEASEDIEGSLSHGVQTNNNASGQMDIYPSMSGKMPVGVAVENIGLADANVEEGGYGPSVRTPEMHAGGASVGSRGWGYHSVVMVHPCVKLEAVRAGVYHL